jgi:hypothetical protein
MVHQLLQFTSPGSCLSAFQCAPDLSRDSQHSQRCRVLGQTPGKSVCDLSVPFGIGGALKTQTLVMTVSSIIPPFSFVKQLSDPVPSLRLAMSPTTRLSMKGMASLPCKHRKQHENHAALCLAALRLHLQSDAAHVRDIEGNCMLPALDGGIHDAIFVLNRHRPPSKWNHLPWEDEVESRSNNNATVEDVEV